MTIAPSTTMRAVCRFAYGDAAPLTVEQVDRPRVGERDVLVRVKAAGVDQGVWHMIAGKPWLIRLGIGLRRPRKPVVGMDLAGVVEAVGAAVTRFAPGDEVFGTGTGTFAEYAVAAEKLLVPMPPGLAFEQAAAVPVSATTALQALRGRVQAGQRVLVIGAGGGVGSYAVQLAKHRGAHVTGLVSTRKVEFVRALGADDVVDYTVTDGSDGTQRWDLILDTGGNRPLRVLRRALARRGTLVLVGSENGPRLGQGMDRSLRALLLSPFVGQRLRGLVSLVKPADLEELATLLAEGALAPAVDRVFPLEEAGAAVAYLRAGAARGKVVLAIG